MKKYVYGLFIFLAGLLFSTTVHAEKEVKSAKNQLIIVNKSNNKLAFYEDGELIQIYSVATGRSSDLTPEGDFDVQVKWKCPIYYKTKTAGCAWDNPLGNRWIGLSVPRTSGYTYGIHGNNAEWSIGTNASSGCVRMYDWQVEELFEMVEEGAKVTILYSNKSFDEIARSKGYALTDDKAVESNAMITVGKQINTFVRPSKFYETTGILYPSTIEVKKQYKNWYYVETETVKGWVKDANINELDTVRELLSYRVNLLIERKGFTFHVNEMVEKVQFPFLHVIKKA